MFPRVIHLLPATQHADAPAVRVGRGGRRQRRLPGPGRQGPHGARRALRPLLVRGAALDALLLQGAQKVSRPLDVILAWVPKYSLMLLDAKQITFHISSNSSFARQAVVLLAVPRPDAVQLLHGDVQRVDGAALQGGAHRRGQGPLLPGLQGSLLSSEHSFFLF